MEGKEKKECTRTINFYLTMCVILYFLFFITFIYTYNLDQSYEVLCETAMNRSKDDIKNKYTWSREEYIHINWENETKENTSNT